MRGCLPRSAVSRAVAASWPLVVRPCPRTAADMPYGALRCVDRLPRCAAWHVHPEVLSHILANASHIAHGDGVIAGHDSTASPRQHHKNASQTPGRHWPEGRFRPLSLPPIPRRPDAQRHARDVLRQDQGSDRGPFLARSYARELHSRPAATPPRARKRRCGTRFRPDPPLDRAPQCPRSRKRGPNIERGRSARRQGCHLAPLLARAPPTATWRTRSTTTPFPSAASAQGSPPPGQRWPDGPIRHRQPPRRRRRRVTRQGRSASGGGAPAP